jgi:hypothetical protein
MEEEEIADEHFENNQNHIAEESLNRRHSKDIAGSRKSSKQ